MSDDKPHRRTVVVPGEPKREPSLPFRKEQGTETAPHRRTVVVAGEPKREPSLPFRKEQHTGAAPDRRGPTLPFRSSSDGGAPPRAQPAPGAPWSKEALPELDVPMGARTKSASAARRSIVPVHAPESLNAVAFPWTLAVGCVLVVVAKCTATLGIDGSVRIHEQARPLQKDVFTPRALSGRSLEQERSLRYASDFAVYKQRADVTAVGHAYAPGGRGPAARVTFRFGDPHRGGFERHIAVFGDRRWQRGMLGATPSAPEPFERMPLVYERAFGGPDSRDNPVGRGMAEERLPNLEHPGQLIDDPSAIVPPMGFGPLAKHWGAEAPALPHHADFPPDFDWTRYQHAPEEQRLQRIVGDEPFAFTAMHAERPRIEGRLPDRFARCVIADAEHRRHELELALDTVAFDLDAMELALVWRGHRPIQHPRASEIHTVTIGLTHGARSTS